jgi:hypothetical protein
MQSSDYTSSDNSDSDEASPNAPKTVGLPILKTGEPDYRSNIVSSEVGINSFG